MKQHKRLARALLGLAAAGGAALAGDEPIAQELPPPSGGCDWCQCLTDKLGEPLYQNNDAMLIQAVRLFGRAQFQFAAIDGEDANGNDFSDTFEEIRRLRLGVDVKALKYFKLHANANFAHDLTPDGGDRDIGYHSLDVGVVSFDAGALLGSGFVDTLTLSYGRHKVALGQEVKTSSKRIKTVERSAPANKIYPNRMTGATIKATKGNLAGTVGVFSTDFSNEIAMPAVPLSLEMATTSPWTFSTMMPTAVRIIRSATIRA
jgi:phosphate-selective porin